MRDPDQCRPRPHICIGTEAFHTQPEMAEMAAAFFQKRGFSVLIDSPYCGALVPEAYYQKNRQAQALMLELNRKLYLWPGGNEKNENFETIKNLVQAFLSKQKNELSFNFKP